MNTIKLILEYDAAYKQVKIQEEALNKFVTVLGQDNSAYIIDNPFQLILDNVIREADEYLYDWYCWWLYEGGGEFTLDSADYDTKDMNLQEFLEIVDAYYKK